MKYFKNILNGLSNPLIFLPISLGFISIIMMLSTSYNNGVNWSDSTVIIQTSAYFLGFIAIFIISKFDYKLFKELEKPLYIVSLIFLLLVYVPGLGVELNGARSWIDLKITTFQPSEIVKISFILLMSTFFQRHSNDKKGFSYLIKAIVYAAPFIVIVLVQDLGSALVFISIWVTMIFFAGIDISLFIKCFILVALSTPAAYYFMAPHQKQRIDAFLHPENLNLGGNYQVWHSKVAIGSGGFWGKGLFNGTQGNLNYLPVKNSDFVFSTLVEETGFIGGSILIFIYGWLILSIMKVIQFCKDKYGQFILIGISGMFVFQIFENIAMTMGIMPVTGITLPFISYGGSSILSNMIAMGFAINIFIANRKYQ